MWKCVCLFFFISFFLFCCLNSPSAVALLVYIFSLTCVPVCRFGSIFANELLLSAGIAERIWAGAESADSKTTPFERFQPNGNAISSTKGRRRSAWWVPLTSQPERPVRLISRNAGLPPPGRSRLPLSCPETPLVC